MLCVIEKFNLTNEITWYDIRIVPGSIPTWGLSVWSLHVLPVYAWVLSGYSGFLPPSKNMHVRLIDDSKLSLGVSVRVCGCLSRLSLCGPVMDWRPVQGVPRLSPNDRWNRLQPPAIRPTDYADIENGRMDIRISFILPNTWTHTRNSLYMRICLKQLS